MYHAIVPSNRYFVDDRLMFLTCQFVAFCTIVDLAFPQIALRGLIVFFFGIPVLLNISSIPSAIVSARMSFTGMVWLHDI